MSVRIHKQNQKQSRVLFEKVGDVQKQLRALLEQQLKEVALQLVHDLMLQEVQELAGEYYKRSSSYRPTLNPLACLP
jgi:hypothetical protein